MTNIRTFKDPQLQMIVEKKYKFQFRRKIKLEEEPSYLKRLTELEIRSKFKVKTLDGIEKLSSLRKLNINEQNKLIDYSNLAHLNNLRYLMIFRPHRDFHMSHLPKLKNLESLTIYLRQNEFNDKIIKFDNFPNLKELRLMGDFNQQLITIDISQMPNIEYIDIYDLNVENIIGLKSAHNLKSIVLSPLSSDYKDEVKKLRPDIELE